jgi:hypothetical protein
MTSPVLLSVVFAGSYAGIGELAKPVRVRKRIMMMGCEHQASARDGVRARELHPLPFDMDGVRARELHPLPFAPDRFSREK